MQAIPYDRRDYRDGRGGLFCRSTAIAIFGGPIAAGVIAGSIAWRAVVRELIVPV